MSDQRMALQPFSTLATYVPEGDQDTELMAVLQEQKKQESLSLGHQIQVDQGSPSRPCKGEANGEFLTCGFCPEFCPLFRSGRSRCKGLHQLSLQPHSSRQD